MSNSVCPWWLGYFLLLNPIRSMIHSPEKILKNHVNKGMFVLDIGCGMGYFSLPMAKLVGDKGSVLAIDLQERMLTALNRRARKANLTNNLETRLCSNNSLNLDDVAGKIDFALAFAMVHEVPDKDRLLIELHKALKSGGKLLIAEPKGHVKEKEFNDCLNLARSIGFNIAERPEIGKSFSALLTKQTLNC
ncbi:class I SAM-dependent methyltransferase [Desulfosporosinus youngiae]|uniref:Methylase involved in ubiquinone/menaquinone biosynthesis n=1 Tax=Desulfosporosinus youngiae DSM 17734 TaxID=768710 RepID=H5XV53_9FIRM|nr:class I SAM-dependent methyltransferase [Desulfosporosinus youngiae]EHQ89651.1 methylase involved in ubiquinone/menaquinone biosynthesis [Desulfosporosinus youngiae DSM 17734]